MKFLSLFARYVKNGTYPSGYHKVITLVSDKPHPHLSAKSNNTNSMEPKEKWPTVSFPVNIAELGITIEEKLEDISRQNIFKWIDRFRTPVKTYNWTDQGARIFLLHESFLSGLNTVTEIEMAKLKAFTMEEILAPIIDVEAFISREAMHQQPNDRNFEPPNDKIMPTTKYCSFFKSHTPNTKSQNLISSIDIEVNLNESSYMATIDTGAESSYTSQQICTEEKIPLNKVKRYQIVCANGSKESGDE
ncbi:hypothetical protein HZS_1568, partial [Henneguya salminicola]